MDGSNYGRALAPLLLRNPIILIVFLIIVLIFGTTSLMNLYALNERGGISDESKQKYYARCQEGNLDKEKFYSMFENAGVFTGMGSFFIQVSNKYQIDPVLLASIAFHETGKGTSNAVRTKNNPGGLMNPKTNKLFVFDSLEEGIDAMARNLYKNYISKGLVSITQIGNKYAPVGANNDPNNLNINWVPAVTQLANEFGGLTMNCTAVNIGSGEFFKPVPNGTITSEFGYRIHPITGQYKLHKGIDFACRKGEPIYSALSGTVVVSVKSGHGGGYGHHIIIDHGDKYTLYAHMTDVFYSEGQQVEQGQPIGTCGSTGNSTGPHLHFEVQLSLYGQRVDPMDYF
jgi:murein DD-endopeptidase MepM/ murein hydrolase activator NlpD